jgi:competence protein ComEC
VGNRIMVPFLRGEGIARLDGLVVSHADEDHSGGAESLAEARAPPWLLSPLPPGHELHEVVERSIRCEAGQRWRWDGVEFGVLHPDAAVYAETGGRPRKENDRGCVVKVSTVAHSMLLGADVEARGEAEMLKRDAPALASEVLLVPHHGSRTSSTPAYLAAVSPEIAIFSVGYLNRFRHPNAMVVERYRARGVQMLRTDAEGALRVVLPASEGEAVKVSGQQETCRYWSQRCATGW